MHPSELVALRTGYLMGFADALGQGCEPTAPGLPAAYTRRATVMAARRSEAMQRVVARVMVALQRCDRCWEDLGAGARRAPGLSDADASAGNAVPGGRPLPDAGQVCNGSTARATLTLPPQDSHGLTRREVEVLRLLAAGLSHREIGEQLVVSVRTVGRHIDNIYGKIGARGRGAARRYALEHGLLIPAPATGT
jgi:DNA-binding CsgD family transcriptional regulator